jgi:endonuclease/exonuclease/phosphatase family metal-dependent hydrolase
MLVGDKCFVAGSPYETMLNLDYCFVRDSLQSHTLYLPSTRGLGIVSDHRYALLLSLGSITDEEKKT